MYRNGLDGHRIDGTIAEATARTGQCNAESRGANHFGVGNATRKVHDEFDECTDPFGERLMDVGSSRINLLLRP